MTTSFKTNEPSLRDLMSRVDAGQVRLPEFQRSWVWDDDHIRALLASVTKAFPIGCIMMLETGGVGVRYKTRLVEGVSTSDPRDTEALLLDGQQRMTSLYLALKSKDPVPTRSSKGQEISRHYYFDMAKCLDPTIDREDAIISVPEDRVVRTNIGRDVALDLSSRKLEFEARVFPADQSFDYSSWRREYGQFHNHDRDAVDQFDRFEREVLETLKTYRIPEIQLTKDTPREAVCIVFEKVNTGGVPLTVFELMTAIFAADEFDLREDWKRRQVTLHEQAALEGVSAPDFLTACTLLSSWQTASGGPGISCKRKDILNLTLSQYQAVADSVERSFVSAAEFLAEQKVFESRNVPYGSQLVPLAASIAAMGNRVTERPVRQKLARWYWCGVFGELYGGSVESRFALDIGDLIRWIDDGDDPRTVKEFTFQPTRLLTLRSRQSAAYKGLFALLVRAGCPDFISGIDLELSNYFDQKVDVHHVFPKKWCKANGKNKAVWDSVVNKTPLTARSNRKIGGRAPSEYLGRIDDQEGFSSPMTDELLQRHLADPRTLRDDNFESFVRHRAAMLLDAIEDATGKSISGRESDEVQDQFGGSVSPVAATA